MNRPVQRIFDRNGRAIDFRFSAKAVKTSSNCWHGTGRARVPRNWRIACWLNAPNSPWKATFMAPFPFIPACLSPAVFLLASHPSVRRSVPATREGPTPDPRYAPPGLQWSSGGDRTPERAARRIAPISAKALRHGGANDRGATATPGPSESACALSFSATSAARTIRFELIPEAIEDIVVIEHGAITIPAVTKEPLASRHPISSGG